MDNEHKNGRNETSTDENFQFSTTLNRFLGRKSVEPHQGHIEHIDVDPNSKTTDDDEKTNRDKHQKGDKPVVPHTVKEMFHKTLQSDRPFSPHPPPNSDNEHPNGSRFKEHHDNQHEIDEHLKSPLRTFGQREITSPAHAPNAPTSLRGRHSPDLFSRERQGGSGSPQITPRLRRGEHGVSREHNESPNIHFSRNVHPNPHDFSQIHEDLFGSRDKPLPLLDSDFSAASSLSSSRASTPRLDDVKKKKKKQKSLLTTTDSSLTSPWEKYKATLPSPLKKMRDTKKKKSSKVKPKKALEDLPPNDKEEQTRL
jgi:hypothetical protein